MSNLTALDLKGQLECCHEISSLPALRSLSLHYLKPLSTSENFPTPLSLDTLTGLTALAIGSTGYLTEVTVPQCKSLVCMTGSVLGHIAFRRIGFV